MKTANGIRPVAYQHRNEQEDANVIMSSEDEHNKYNLNHHQMNGGGGGTATATRTNTKTNDGRASDDEIGPPLPPRPPPRQRFVPSADTGN